MELPNIVKDLVASIDNCEHNDVLIKVDDGQVAANKFMLSVRSTYFAAMFSKSSNFKEEKEFMNKKKEYERKMIEFEKQVCKLNKLIQYAV